jgi:putative transposase
MNFRSYKFRLYPTSEQAKLLIKHFRAYIFVYNYFLSRRIEHYNENSDLIEQGKVYNLSVFDNYKHLKTLRRDPNYSFLRDVSVVALRSAIYNLDIAVKINLNKNNFPKLIGNRFKVSSFSITDQKNLNLLSEYKIGAKLFQKICFIKFQEGIEFRKTREIEGHLIKIHIVLKSDNKYYVVFVTEQKSQEHESIAESIELTIGNKEILKSNFGHLYTIPKKFFYYNKLIRKIKNQVSQKVAFSNRYNKSMVRLQKIRQKKFNILNNFLHEITTEIIKQYKKIYITYLNENSDEYCLNPKYILYIIKQLEYKALLYGNHRL